METEGGLSEPVLREKPVALGLQVAVFDAVDAVREAAEHVLVSLALGDEVPLWLRVRTGVSDTVALGGEGVALLEKVPVQLLRVEVGENLVGVRVGVTEPVPVGGVRVAEPVGGDSEKDCVKEVLWLGVSDREADAVGGLGVVVKLKDSVGVVVGADMVGECEGVGVRVPTSVRIRLMVSLWEGETVHEDETESVESE